MEFRVQSCVRGFHVYGEHWTAFVGEELTCQREIGNVVDRYAVAVEKATGETVGARAEENFQDMQLISAVWWYNYSHSDWSSKVFIRPSTGRARNSVQP